MGQNFLWQIGVHNLPTILLLQHLLHSKCSWRHISIEKTLSIERSVINKMVWEWWMDLIDHEDADVLAVSYFLASWWSTAPTSMSPQALAVRIFALMPILMVEECAVSVMTWINSAKWSRQSVATVSNHLQIWQFEQKDVQNMISVIYALKIIYIWHVWILSCTRIDEKKQLSIWWCDMQSTIHKPLRKANLNPVTGETEVCGDEVSEILQLRVLLILQMDSSGLMIAFLLSFKA